MKRQDLEYAKKDVVMAGVYNASGITAFTLVDILMHAGGYTYHLMAIAALVILTMVIVDYYASQLHDLVSVDDIATFDTDILVHYVKFVIYACTAISGFCFLWLTLQPNHFAPPLVAIVYFTHMRLFWMVWFVKIKKESSDES